MQGVTGKSEQDFPAAPFVLQGILALLHFFYNFVP